MSGLPIKTTLRPFLKTLDKLNHYSTCSAIITVIDSTFNLRTICGATCPSTVVGRRQLLQERQVGKKCSRQGCERVAVDEQRNQVRQSIQTVVLTRVPTATMNHAPLSRAAHESWKYNGWLLVLTQKKWGTSRGAAQVRSVISDRPLHRCLPRVFGWFCSLGEQFDVQLNYII